jgi:hypothetical protein
MKVKLKSRNKPIECHNGIIYLTLLLGLNRPLDKVDPLL